ncbi:MAG: hypothetical protein AAFR64_04015 [Pseudomonadota bacterium]
MSNTAKALIGMVFLGVWGPYLLYVWLVPGAVPEWVYSYGLRRVFMLSRDYEPTFFTLMFGIMFTSIVFVGAFRIATGKIAEQ